MRPKILTPTDFNYFSVRQYRSANDCNVWADVNVFALYAPVKLEDESEAYRIQGTGEAVLRSAL